MKVCKNCKTALEDNQKFCHICGSNEFEDKDFVKNENTSCVYEINEGTANSVKNIQTNYQNNKANEEKVEYFNPTVTSTVEKTAPAKNINKIIIVASAIVAVVIVIILTIIIAVSTQSKRNHPTATTAKTTYSNSASTPEEKTTKETTEAKDMVSLISMCPTYEEFMDKLISSKVTEKSVKEVSGGKQMNATFNYSGVVVSIWYSKDEPHYIKSIMLTDMTTSTFSESWYYSTLYAMEEIVTPYLDGVPNSESFETVINDKFPNNTKTEQSDYANIVKAEHKLSGIKYSIELSVGSYASYNIFTVSIDEDYMIEKPKNVE